MHLRKRHQHLPIPKTPVQCHATPVVDHDLDNNNLIDIDSLAKLKAIRCDLTGDSLPDNRVAYATVWFCFFC